MDVNLLAQGYKPDTSNSVGQTLIKFLANKDFSSFTCISAFASQSGVNGLAKHIEAAKEHLKTITIIVGIDQKATSREALEALLALNVNTFIFYQPSFTIFHPKIYLFEGEKKSELIIGSSNLTTQGLFMNVETSLLVSVDNNHDNDRKVLEQLKEYYDELLSLTHPNLQKLDEKIISLTVEAGIVPSEEQRRTLQQKLNKPGKEATLISDIFPKIEYPKVPDEFRGLRPNSEAMVVMPQAEKPSGTHLFTTSLLWTSGPLTERDLNIPKGKNTHPTGSMSFNKGPNAGIDQKHHFRDEVFSDLKWIGGSTPNKAHLEKATAKFKIIVNGEDKGDFELKINHNPKKDTGSYKQNNSMTSLSWGPAKEIIARKDLLGKNALLFGTEDPDVFVLEIK